MAFRALLFSKSPETNTAMTAACQSSGIRAEVCSDIFTAIEKGKTRAFSCVIADWADQPEASFLLKRARESEPNRDTVAIVIVDNEPTSAEMRDNRVDFLIYRPIAVAEAEAVLGKALERMQPLSALDSELSAAEEAGGEGPSRDQGGADATGHGQPDEPAEVPEDRADGEIPPEEEQPAPPARHAIGNREVCAVLRALAAVLCLWRSRAAIEYVSETPEGVLRVLEESVGALFYLNQTGALPVGSAGSDAQQDAYFSRG